MRTIGDLPPPAPDGPGRRGRGRGGRGVSVPGGKPGFNEPHSAGEHRAACPPRGRRHSLRRGHPGGVCHRCRDERTRPRGGGASARGPAHLCRGPCRPLTCPGRMLAHRWPAHSQCHDGPPGRCPGRGDGPRLPSGGGEWGRGQPAARPRHARPAPGRRDHSREPPAPRKGIPGPPGRATLSCLNVTGSRQIIEPSGWPALKTSFPSTPVSSAAGEAASRCDQGHTGWWLAGTGPGLLVLCLKPFLELRVRGQSSPALTSTDDK